MTKQEKIQEAYEEIGLPFNENVIYDNGWLKIKPTQYSSKYDLVDLLKLTSHVHSIRPKSLSGIENNNGWIKIESEDDLPKLTIEYHVLKNGSLTNAYYVKNNRWVINDNPYPKTTEIQGITHYQPIEKPQPPIY